MGILNWLAPMDREVTIGGIRFSIHFGSGDGAEPNYTVDLLSIPGISSAIEIKSNDVSQIPLKLYLRTPNGRQRLRTTLDYRLNSRPNSYQNAAQFWKTVAMQATSGECFISTRGGELNILRYGLTYRYVTTTGEVRYAEVEQAAENNTQVVIKNDYAWNEVLHLWTFQDEMGAPYHLRDRFRRVLGLASDMHKYTTRLYNRGGTLAGYLSTDHSVNDDKKKTIIQAFKSMFKSSRVTATEGADPLISALDNGWKWNKVDLTPQEMMLLEAKKDLRLDFAQIMNMPPWKLGQTENYHYSTSESAQREYIGVCLNPLLNLIEKEIEAKMFSGPEVGRLYVEFDRDALVSLDAKTMAEVDDIHIKNGTINTDEARERLNLEHSGQGIRQIPVNVTSADFVTKNEALKLEAAALDIEIKKAQLEQTRNQPKSTTPPALPADPKPETTPGEPPTDYAASLKAVQDKYAATMAPDAWKDTAAVTAMIAGVCGEIGAMYGIADHVASFAARYTKSALERLANATAVPAYEINRAVNAANHEAMKLCRGVNAKVKWVGGVMDGQVRGIMEPAKNNQRHPPIDENYESFLIPA
jgi:HK97 family phage portal protein